MEEEDKKLKHIKTEIKEEAEKLRVMGDKPYKEEEIPPGVSTDPGDTRKTRREVKAEEEEEHANLQREAILEIGTDPGDTRGTQRNVKAEEEEEHANLQREAILEIGTDGQYRLQNGDKSPTASYPSSSKKMSFMCLECGKLFRRKHHLLIHQRVHTGEKPFACSECGKCFADQGNLIRHKRSHSDFFSCSKCGKQCPTWRTLTTHRKVHLSD